jgi:Lipocalin-like domain
MNRSMKEVGRVLVVVIAMVVWTLSGAIVTAAQAAGGLEQQIQGTWILVSCVNEQDGKKVDVFGPNPRGSLILTPDGRYSQIIMRASLPKFASNSRMKGTAQENEAVVQGTHVYFGRYTVASEKEGTVNLSVEGSTFPNWDEGVQKRVMTVSGDELRVTNPTPSIGSGTNYVIWNRAK